MGTIIGNEKAVKYILDSLESGSLSHAYLFYGPLSVGKTTLAIEMARRLLCTELGDIDCNCPSCRFVSNHSHPDLHEISGFESGIDEVREVGRQLELKPYQSNYRVAIINHADSLSIPALNSFLKTLEEPCDKTIIILTAENKNNLLETIVSRTRQVSFMPITDKVLYDYLNQDLAIPREQARDISILSAGRVGVSLDLLDERKAVEDQIIEAKNFLRVFKSQSVTDKISLASKLIGKKDETSNSIGNFQTVFRKMLLNSVESGKETDSKLLVVLLDSLAKAEGFLKANSNAKMVLESVLLRSL